VHKLLLVILTVPKIVLFFYQDAVLLADKCLDNAMIILIHKLRREDSAGGFTLVYNTQLGICIL